MRRVVVTGLGLVTPLGTGVKSVWENVINSRCGIVSLKDRPGFSDLPVTIGAAVKQGPSAEGGFDASEWMDRGDDRTTALFTRYAIASAKQALKDAGWTPQSEEEKERTGVCLGSGMGSLEDLYTTSTMYSTAGYKKVSPMFVPKILINMAAGHLTMKFGFKGPNHAASTACTTGAHSIGDAMRFIQFNDADVMLAGGSEACIHPLAVAGFCKAKSLASAYNDDPESSSRPFDKDRSGFVIGEGAGVVVLEEYEHAKKRGANIYAEIKGYGLSGDAHHMTAPPENGEGAARAMRRALANANMTPADIDYVNAHATSTPQGDVAENRAIKSIFDGYWDKISVSSTKGATGHLLGAAGAVEAIFTILAIKNNVLPPTLNLHGFSNDEFNLNYVPLVAQDGKEIRAALTNSFGFGGTNASLCFTKLK
ncbi:Mitochondrial beta-keto-acyl synthase [Umbelopsis nana]